MMTSPKQMGILVGLILTIVLGTWGITRLVGMIGQPFGGFMTFYNGIIGEYNIEASTPPWWTARRVYDFPASGTLHTIGGYPYQGFDERALYLRLVQEGNLYPMVDGYADGADFQRRVALIPFSVRHFFDLKAPDVLLAIVFWLLAFVVFQSRPTHTQNQIFALICALFALNRCLENASLYESTSVIDRGLMFINTAMYGPLSGALFVHFGLSFPTRWQRFRRMLLGMAYGFALLITTAFAGSYYLSWTYGFSRTAAELDSFGFYRMWYFYVGGLGFILFRLMWEAIRQWRERRMQRQLTILAVGFMVASPFVVIRLLKAINISYTDQHHIATLDTRFFLLGIPIAFAYVIIRYQTFRGAPPIFLGAVALTISAFVANGVAAVIYALNPGWLTDTDAAISWILFLVIFATAILAGLQGHLRGSFGRLLHTKQYDYDAVRRFGQRLLAVENPAAIPEKVLDELVGTMELERAVLYLWDAPRSEFRLNGSAGGWAIELPPALPCTTSVAFLPEEILRPGRDSLPDGFILPTALADATETLVFLTSNGVLVGLLCTSRRWDEVEPNEQFDDILQLVTQQATLFLVTAQQILYLRGIPHIISQAQEKIQMRLARDLHDAVQQYFTRMPLHLETLRYHLNRWDIEHANDLLDTYTEDTVMVSEDLYRIRADLAPHNLKETMNLTRSLRELAVRFAGRTGIKVDATIEDGLDRYVQAELRLTFYRTIQQALENIHRHAQATLVKVWVYRDGAKVHFEITDNGQGFNIREALAATDTFGLHSMQSRIREDCDGDIEWVSSYGRGTTVSGWIPTSQTVVRSAAPSPLWVPALPAS
jgi:signal transduction histidine kinase